jgi:hypothetical protein
MVNCPYCQAIFTSSHGLGGHIRWKHSTESYQHTRTSAVQDSPTFEEEDPLETPVPSPVMDDDLLPKYDINSFECRYLREQQKLLDRNEPINVRPGRCKMFGEKKYGCPDPLHYILITAFMEKYSLSNEVGNALLLLIRQLSTSAISPGEIPLPKEYKAVRDHIVSRSKDRLRIPKVVEIDLPTELYGDLTSIPAKDRTSKSPSLNLITAIG